MSNVDFGRYKKIVKLFWDPEPKNDDASQAPIWCLGKEYSAAPKSHTYRDGVSLGKDGKEDGAASPLKEEGSFVTPEKTDNVAVNGGREDTPVRADQEDGRSWPSEFLDDFESRIWMTYRSSFPAIKKSNDRKASSAMSLSVRLRSQLDQGGFTADTGWGCMIRSGQSVLANTLVMLRLGRGQGINGMLGSKMLTDMQTGGDIPGPTRRKESCRSSPTTPKPHFQYKDSSNMAPLLAVSIQVNGSALQPPPDASSKWMLPAFLFIHLTAYRALSDRYAETGLKVYVNGDGADVYEDTFMKLAKGGDDSFTPTLILLGIRLGIDRVTPVYWESLKAALRLSQSIGIAGWVQNRIFVRLRH